MGIKHGLGNVMNYRIPFGGLKIGAYARGLIADTIEENWVSEGPLVREFEKRFAARFCYKHAIVTSSGTDAGTVIWSAVRELCGRRWGDGVVLTPACAFVATASCLLASGCNPRFIDVDLETLNIDVKAIKENTTPVGILRNLPTIIQTIRHEQTVGIQFVATMGNPSPIDEVAEIVEAHNLYLIADQCESHGAMLHGKDVGRYADASIYSFYAAHLIVGGEGGIICTDDDELADMCRSIKSHGRPLGSIYFDFQRPGFNSKWNEFCAAVALEGLENFDENFAKRRRTRKRLYQMLASLNLAWGKFILYPDEWPDQVISPHAFPLVLKDPDGNIAPLYECLDKSGIQCKTLFGSLPTQHRAFEFLGYKPGDFPVAERVGRTGLQLPCNEFMTDDDVVFVVDKIREFCLKEDM